MTGDLHIRFYAGAPLAGRDGHLLGTLCLIDREPRTLTPAQTEALKIVSHLVVANIELRCDLRELKDALGDRDAAGRASGDDTGSLDEIISRLRDAVSNLEAARGTRIPRSDRQKNSLLSVSVERAPHDPLPVG